MLLLKAVLEVLTQRGGRAGHEESSPRRVRDAHQGTNVVPPICNLGLLLDDNEERVRGVRA